MSNNGKFLGLISLCEQLIKRQQKNTENTLENHPILKMRGLQDAVFLSFLEIVVVFTYLQVIHGRFIKHFVAISEYMNFNTY
jgi:hypothetical protein